MANEVKHVAVERKRSLREVDSELIITLYKGEREPEIVCTKPGRMTGQMIMGLEGIGMRRIEVVLRQAQNAITVQPERNTKSLEQRVYITSENSPQENSNA